MDLKLVNSIALTAHVRVAHAGLAPLALDEATHPLFQGNVLAFEASSGERADSVAAWLESLRASGASAFALRADASISVSTATPGVWTPSSDLIEPRPTTGPIWRLCYREQPGAPPGAPAVLDVPSASARLQEALDAAETLSRDGNALGWASFFGNAKRAFDDNEEPKRAWSLLPDAGYGESARRLLRAAECGWAFGGMGSWNDFEFETSELRRRYGAVTQQLHAAVVGGVLSATNCALD